MERKKCWHTNHEVRDRLNQLPRKIMSMQNKGNLVEFVLHELCHDSCFNIGKAAYIIDNPDFDCMRGVAGFSHDEQYKNQDIWQHPEEFSQHMNNAMFNQKVRSLQRHSCHRHNEARDDVVKELATSLGMKVYGCCNIPMRNDNHGLFLYEYNIENEEDHECLLNGASLLSFCPIY